MGSVGHGPNLEGLAFNSPTVSVAFAALLFDFDGTIIDSTDAIEKHWHLLGKELGVDPNVILATSHGRRSIDTLRMYDESKANWDFVKFIEGRIPEEFGQDAVEIPGARTVLDSLDHDHIPWAIVTSGTDPLVSGWIKVMRLARPQNVVTAEDVGNGKPDPECYLLGRDKLGIDSKSSILVIEDAPAGVKAGKAAGFSVLGLATTHEVQQLKDAGADWIVRDLRSLVVDHWDKDKELAQLEIRNSLSN